MEETLEMMKSILTGKESKENEKKLIKEYKEMLSPNILAYFYCNNIGIIKSTSRLYPILDNEDKASFCLQELDKCLQTYNLEVNNKFITYFIKCYKNRLRTQTEQLLTNKRKAQLYLDLTDDYLNTSIDFDIENTDLILNNYNLNKDEKDKCKLLNDGYTINEIASFSKLKPITIYKQISKIKEKILNSNIKFA